MLALEQDGKNSEEQLFLENTYGLFQVTTQSAVLQINHINKHRRDANDKHLKAKLELRGGPSSKEEIDHC